MPEPQSSDDPRKAGGRMFDAGDPHSRGQVMFDSRNTVLVESIETAVAHTTQHGKPGPDVVALSIHGRINRPPDDAIAGFWVTPMPNPKQPEVLQAAEMTSVIRALGELSGGGITLP